MFQGVFWITIYFLRSIDFLLIMFPYKNSKHAKYFFSYQESSFEMAILENKLKLLENTQILRQRKMGGKLFFYFYFLFIYFSWRLNTLQYCSDFCHTLIWISHGFTCVPHPEPLSHLPPHLIPLGHPSTPALSTLSHTLNLDWWFVSYMIIACFNVILSDHPTLSFSHRV